MGQINNLIPNKLHPITGEELRPTIVTVWRDGTTPMSDSLCGGLYNKDTESTSPTVGQYFKWNSSGAYPISRLTTINQSNFQKLINDFGNSPTTILLDKSLSITSGIVNIPSNIKLKQNPNAIITISSGTTLNINSPIYGNPTQLFSVLGTLTLINKEVYPEWFGAKGDGITDDTAILQKMCDIIPNGTRVSFGSRSYNFNLVNLVNKTSITFNCGSSTFNGTFLIGDANPTAAIFDTNFRSIGAKFVHTDNTKNCYEFANTKGFCLENTISSGSNAVVYIKPIDKFQHVNRGSISGTGGGSKYLFYADNPINVAPYTNIQMTTGDIEINNNPYHRATVSNILAFGIDGLTVTGNTFFMPNNAEKSQVKNQNIRIVAGNWITITGNKLFESGLEGVLFERCRNWTVIGNHFAWSGQRDVNFGFGFRITGGGYLDVNYTTGVISDNIFDRVSGTGVRLDSGTTGVTVHDNRYSGIGNPLFYYGNGALPVGDPNTIPLINSVPHYAVSVAADTKRCSVHHEIADNVDFDFQYDDSLGLSSLDLLKHYANTGRNGLSEGIRKTLTTLDSLGKIDVGNTNNIAFNLPSNNTNTVKDLINANLGDVVYLYNTSANNVIIENNSTIQLATNANYKLLPKTTLTLQKRLDKWFEISRNDSGKVNLGLNSGEGYNTISNPPLLDISTGDLPGVVVGADDGLTTRTNSIAKSFKMGMVPYLISQLTNAVLSLISDATNNSIIIGGGTSSMNAATSVDVYTAANNATITGIRRTSVNSAGLFRTFFGFLGVSGSDTTVPVIAKGNSAAQSANLFSAQNSAGNDQVGVTADGSLFLDTVTAASNKDVIWRRSGLGRWIARMNTTTESGSNNGSDLEIISRTDAGTLLDIVARIFRSSGNIVIGNDSDSPSAKLSISSTTKGFLVPRLTTIQRDAIVSPASGLEVWNTNKNKKENYNGTIWETNQTSLTVITTLDFPSVGADQNATLTVSVPGASIGDVVTLGIQNSILSGLTWNATFVPWVSATDTVSIRFQNHDTVAHDLASASFIIKILK